jgi:protein-S-isoprenylcysteine O-methyltransferase Ste14
MSDLILKIAYLAGLMAEIAIRAPYNRRRRQTKIATDQVNATEIVVLVLFFLGNFVLPLVYVFTPWLSFADYTLPDWAGWIGLAILVSAIAVFWRAHVDLGQNWSPTLQIREGHALVTTGLYRHIRHPMYASQWLWVIAQALLLQNWIAGLGGLILFLPLYLVRVPREEALMVAEFGEAYRTYMQRTGRVVPRWHSHRLR